jgi:hypothetical protein
VKVVLNSWIGDKFINDNMCDWCGEPSTTINLDVGLPYGTLDFCKSCLLNMVAEIDKAILESKTYETS